MRPKLLSTVSRFLSIRRTAKPPGGGPTRDTLILYFNTMWDQPIDTKSPDVPAGCRLTTDLRLLAEADAVVFHIPSLARLPSPKPPGQIWVAWSLECDANYPVLRDPSFMRLFDLTMTYRLDADVLDAYTSYYSDGANLCRALREPAKPKTPGNLVTMLISSGINRSGRIGYASELMRCLDVHSYGKVLQNRRVPDDRWRPSKLAIIAGCKFNLAFENAISEDYVSEKFFDPLVAGTVPVYLGAPNVAAFAPGEHCYIDTADFRGPRELAQYLLHLDTHDAEYQAYFAWKECPFRPPFLALLERQHGPLVARLCRAVRERQGQRP